MFHRIRRVTLTCFALAMVLVLNSASAQSFKYLEVAVVDENGKPMSDVSVEIRMEGLEFPMPTNAEGVVSLNVAASKNPVELKVRHEGYELRKQRWRRGFEVPAKFTFEMEPGKPRQGWVYDANGQPVAGAETYTAEPDKWLTFVNGRRTAKSDQKPVTTDDNGKFTMPYQPSGSTIVCVSDSGWAQFIKPKEDRDQIEINLSPWVEVQLKTRPQDEAGSRGKVGLHFVHGLGKDRGQVKWLYEGATDEQGIYRCQRVIPGTAMAYREVPVKQIPGQRELESRSHGVVVTLRQGQQTQIQIGGADRAAKGKLYKPVNYRGEALWESGYVVLTENNTVDLVLRTAIFEYGKLLSQSTVVRPEERVPPSGVPNYLVRYISSVRADGSFEIDEVPAGQYKLSAVIPAKPKDDPNRTDVLTLSDLSYTIMKNDGNQVFDLGEHVLDFDE